MKKTLTVFSVLVLLGSLVKTTFAVTPPLTSQEEKREEIRERLEEKKLLIEKKRNEIQLRIEQKRATRQAQLTVRNKERVRQYFGILNNKFEAAILRLETLIERIESRIEKLSETGDVDTTDVEIQLEEAKDLLNEAKAELEAANDSLESVLGANDPKTAFGAVKDTVIDIKAKLKEVHLILVHVIGDVRGLHEGLGGFQVSTQSGQAE